MKYKFSRLISILAITIGLAACGGSSSEPTTESVAPSIADTSALTSEMIAVGDAVGAGEYAFETVDYLSHNFGSLDDGKGNKYMVLAGSEAAHETADWIQGEMERIGLQDVTKEAYPIHAYELNGSSLTLVDSGEVIPTTTMAQTPPTPEGGITAELVDVGFGLRSDYEGKDVAGKIILLSFNWREQFYFNATMFEAKTHGVAGIIYDFLGQQNIPDSLFSYPLSPFDGQALPALNISHNSIASLREKLADGPLTVTMELDAVDAFEGTDHNVLGYIKGNKYPDELIVIGDHFDHYFYGTLDCGTCVGSVLGLAKAFVDSGYEPDRTLVFVAHGAEENGWHTAWGPYINGAWNLIANAHPDWAGRTVAFFGWDWNGNINSRSVRVDTYTNEVYTFIDSLRPSIDEYFTNRLPWSEYYQPASGPERGGLSHQGWDALAYSNRGVPVFGLRDADADPQKPGSYHTQFDDISQTSGESMALGMIATAIAAIELDRTAITPYDFSIWADRLGAKLTEDQAGLSAQGIDINENLDAIQAMGQAAKQFHGLVVTDSNASAATSAAVNELQRQAAIQVIPRMYFSAGDFPYSSQWRHSQYLRDATALSETISALESGDAAVALENLLNVASAYYGTNVSYEVHKAWIDFKPAVLFSDSTHGPRIPKYTDVWHEAESVKAKIASADSDFTDEIASLTATHAVVKSRLRTTYDEMVAALLSAEAPIAEAKSLLEAGSVTEQTSNTNEQKAVLVTGASTGIGRTIAEKLAAEGYFVYAGARKASDLEALDAIDNMQSVRLDVTDQDEIDAAVEFVKNEGRGLYGVVNNAGVAVFGPLLTSPEDDLDWVFDVNVYGPYRVNKAFAPLIIENGGRFTTIGSVSGIDSGALLGMYSMSKFAVEAYTDALAEELRAAGIHVSVVEPGGFKSKMAETTVERLMKRHEDGTAVLSEDLIQIAHSFVEANPQQKDPAEVADAVLHALSADKPKRRYLVTPNEGEARSAIESAMQKVVELNQDHLYSMDRDELVSMLDELLEK